MKLATLFLNGEMNSFYLFDLPAEEDAARREERVAYFAYIQDVEEWIRCQRIKRAVLPRYAYIRDLEIYLTQLQATAASQGLDVETPISLEEAFPDVPQFHCDNIFQVFEKIGFDHTTQTFGGV